MMLRVNMLRAGVLLACVCAIAALVTGCPRESKRDGDTNSAPTRSQGAGNTAANAGASQSGTKGANPEGDQLPEAAPDVPSRATEVAEKDGTSSALPPENIVRFDGGLIAVVGTDNDHIEVPALVLGAGGQPLEFLVVTQAGAVHEALLRVECKAIDIKHAMELLLMREGQRKPRYRGDATVPDGELVDIDVMWKDAGGTLRLNRIEDWIYNRVEKDNMTPGPWVFTGSQSIWDESLRRERFLADEAGNVIAIWRDPTCLIDNPRDSATDDMAYIARSENGVMPAMNSRVRMIIRKHDPARLPKPANAGEKSGE